MKAIRNAPTTRLKQLQKLSQKKYRDEYRMFIVEGVHLVEEALGSSWEIDSVILRKDVHDQEKIGPILRKAAGRKIEVQTADQKEFARLADTVNSQGILAVVRMPREAVSHRWGDRTQKFIAVALNSITDPGNLGTIIRTCSWFGVEMILLDRGSVELYNAKVVRSTMGAIFHVPVALDVDLVSAISEAKENGVTIYATHLQGKVELGDCAFTDRVMLLLGNESRGVEERLGLAADVSLLIQRAGKGESLNVAVAAGIILQEIVSKGGSR